MYGLLECGGENNEWMMNYLAYADTERKRKNLRALRLGSARRGVSHAADRAMVGVGGVG